MQDVNRRGCCNTSLSRSAQVRKEQKTGTRCASRLRGMAGELSKEARHSQLKEAMNGGWKKSVHNTGKYWSERNGWSKKV